jgi:hypothetical protein
MSLSIGKGDSSTTKGGPATQEGKVVVRWNATRHGIRSPAPVVPGVERAEDWEEHRDGVLESLSPEGHLEEMLAERVALLSWRLHRVTRYETESIALSQEKMEDDLADKAPVWQLRARIHAPKGRARRPQRRPRSAARHQAVPQAAR